MEKLRVSTVGTSAPSIVVPPKQGDALLTYLAENGVSGTYQSDRGSVVVTLKQDVDVEKIQALLDKWEFREISSDDAGALDDHTAWAKVAGTGSFTPPPSFVIVWDP